MNLENARDIVRGILILVFVGIAYWIDLAAGFLLLVGMGVLVFQSAFTDWCPADPFLKLLGLRKKLVAS
jgi:hypothetical protein